MKEHFDNDYLRFRRYELCQAWLIDPDEFNDLALFFATLVLDVDCFAKDKDGEIRPFERCKPESVKAIQRRVIMFMNGDYERIIQNLPCLINEEDVI